MALEWKEIADGSFKGVTFHYAIPSRNTPHGATRQEISSGRRLQVIERPLQDGAIVRDWGAKAKRIQLEIIFSGPNYEADFDAFEQVLNQGTPGNLVLPDHREAFTASFESMSEVIQMGSGGTKSVTVSFVLHTDLDSIPAADSQASANARVNASLANTTSILKDNVFLSAVNAAESGLSAAKRLANTVLTLEQGVRDRILDVQANISSTLALCGEAIASTKAIFQSSAAQSVASKIGSVVQHDKITGQRIVDFSSPDTVPSPADPLAKPDRVAPNPTTIPSIQNAQTANIALSNIVDSLKSNRDELSSLSGGRTDDLSTAITQLINDFQDFVALSVQSQQVQVLVPKDMSLLEVMFYNGVPVDSLWEVQKNNTSISDPMVVTAGTIVVL